MPEKQTLARARADKRAGKAPSTQAEDEHKKYISNINGTTAETLGRSILTRRLSAKRACP